MSNSRYSLGEIGYVTGVCTLFSGLGAGMSAAIRGDSAIKSASITGIGVGSLIAIGGFFGKKQTDSSAEPTLTRMIPSITIIELLGTAIGYAGTKLFIDTAASAMPFVDATLGGVPITLGGIYCAKLLFDYCQRNQCCSSALTPHIP